MRARWHRGSPVTAVGPAVGVVGQCPGVEGSQFLQVEGGEFDDVVRVPSGGDRPGGQPAQLGTFRRIGPGQVQRRDGDPSASGSEANHSADFTWAQ